MIRRSTERNNSPSAATYKIEEAKKNTQFDRAFTKHTIGKSKKRPYFDGVQDRARKVPGAGAYNAHISLDKVARPMKKY
jgi:hypothetical protein